MDHKFLHFRVHVGLRCGPCSDFLISRNYESHSNSPVQHLELVTTIDTTSNKTGNALRYPLGGPPTL